MCVCVCVCVCVCGIFSITSLPPQYFLHLSRNRDQFVHGGKTIKVSFEFKGKDTFFVRECLRQKRLKNLFEIFKS